ncbi:MAG TPA: hypothetical protein VGD71_40120 [Kribbella sp.]
MNATATDTSPEFLRDAMITKIKEAGYTLSPSVERALRTVERHVFCSRRDVGGGVRERHRGHEAGG